MGRLGNFLAYYVSVPFGRVLQLMEKMSEEMEGIGHFEGLKQREVADQNKRRIGTAQEDDHISVRRLGLGNQ